MPRRLVLPHAEKTQVFFAAVLKEHGQDHLFDHYWAELKPVVVEVLFGAITRACQPITVKVKAKKWCNVWQTLVAEEMFSWDIHLADGSQAVEHRGEVHLLFHSDYGRKWNFSAFYKDAGANHYARHYPGQGWGDEAKPGVAR